MAVSLARRSSGDRPAAVEVVVSAGQVGVLNADDEGGEAAGPSGLVGGARW
ncbi:hypothetical protein [Streptomyces sp. AK02-01A]|uniref:hypothetical protein n=1 Tax=Streptomyces sp. AK02-01A TaxID=3028648 RepID=UPI0029AE6450|nr:hypothetical protein [Streptomyces sp. AK02-01A]MDX3855789.1 hypothetical protein [Streptomyces sp. AK02-01A]